jgi:hypothetical protein
MPVIGRFRLRREGRRAFLQYEVRFHFAFGKLRLGSVSITLFCVYTEFSDAVCTAILSPNHVSWILGRLPASSENRLST